MGKPSKSDEDALMDCVSLVKKATGDMQATNKMADNAIKNLKKAKRSLKKIVRLGRE